MKLYASFFCVLLLGVTIFEARGESANPEAKPEDADLGLFDCVFEDNSFGCLRKRVARNLDQIEQEVTGRGTEPPVSALIEQTADFVTDLVDDLQQPESSDASDQPQDDARGIEEARKKKFGKKKKKHLQKLLGLAMLFKAKIGLLLQLISTHFQVKFFILAIINLALNAARFWIDLKKSHPAKVVYYEHAQHQHHYDHDDHDHSGYWGRSLTQPPQDLAYNAYKPQN